MFLIGSGPTRYTYSGAYYNRGNAYYQLEEYDSALLDFDQAIRLEGTLALAYAGRALVFTHLGQNGLAKIDTEMAVALGVQRELLEAEIDSIKSKRRVFGSSLRGKIGPHAPPDLVRSRANASYPRRASRLC